MTDNITALPEPFPVDQPTADEIRRVQRWVASKGPSRKGVPWSEEQKAKLRATKAARGWKPTPEHVAALVAGRRAAREKREAESGRTETQG
jgi:hypothetical protein